jgi:hypothetical protein
MQRVRYLRLGTLFCWRMQTNCSIDLEQPYLASFFSVFFCGFEQMCRRLDRFKPIHIDPDQFVHLSAPSRGPPPFAGCLCVSDRAGSAIFGKRITKTRCIFVTGPGRPLRRTPLNERYDWLPRLWPRPVGRFQATHLAVDEITSNFLFADRKNIEKYSLFDMNWTTGK